MGKDENRPEQAKLIAREILGKPYLTEADADQLGLILPPIFLEESLEMTDEEILTTLKRAHPYFKDTTTADLDQRIAGFTSPHFKGNPETHLRTFKRGLALVTALTHAMDITDTQHPTEFFLDAFYKGIAFANGDQIGTAIHPDAGTAVLALANGYTRQGVSSFSTLSRIENMCGYMHVLDSRVDRGKATSFVSGSRHDNMFHRLCAVIGLACAAEANEGKVNPGIMNPQYAAVEAVAGFVGDDQRIKMPIIQESMYHPYRVEARKAQTDAALGIGQFIRGIVTGPIYAMEEIEPEIPTAASQ